jgi:hypothetical protein
MTLRDQIVLDLLRDDLEAGGTGVSRALIAQRTMSLYPERSIAALRRQGLLIEQVEDRYRLHVFDDVEETGGAEPAEPAKAASAVGAADWQSSQRDDVPRKAPAGEDDAGLIPRASAAGSLSAAESTSTDAPGGGRLAEAPGRPSVASVGAGELRLFTPPALGPYESRAAA